MIQNKLNSSKLLNKRSQQKCGGTFFDPYQYFTHVGKREGGVVGRPEWSTYQKGTKTTIEPTTINWKNLVVTTRFGGGAINFEHYKIKVGLFKKGNEGIEAKGGAHRSLPSLDGGIWQPQNGICLHEGKTPNLSKLE